MNYLEPLVIIALIVLIAVGCDQRESAESAPQNAPVTGTSTEPKVEVKVLSDGSVFMDGKQVTLAAIDQRFAELAKTNGVVWYYRESGKSEPPAVAKKIIEMVIKYRLPISLSTKPDFSDTVDDQGISHPK